MTKRPPNWQRKGFRTESEYKAACAATRETRKAALLCTKTKLGHKLVLKTMWEKAEFDRPFVTITKQQIMADLDMSLATVKRAWVELRAEGSIKPARNWSGGAKVATTWMLTVSGSNKTPAEAQIEFMKVKRDRDAAFKYLAHKFGALKAIEILGDPDEEPDEE